MAKGCIVLLAVFAAARFLERRELDRLELPYASFAATLLAAGVAMFAGGLQGIAEAWSRRRQPESGPEAWTEGALVRLSGRLLAEGPPVRAPFSGRDVVLYWYGARARQRIQTRQYRQPSWRGLDMAPCVIETAHGRVRLKGFPSLRLLSIRTLSSDEAAANAARHLVSTEWTTAPDMWSLDLEKAQETFSGASGTLPSHLINRLAMETLGMGEPGADETHYQRKLKELGWHYHERAVEPGEMVTVTGTYRTAPPHVDIALSTSMPQHEIQIGGAEQTASRHLGHTLLFVVGIAAVVAAAHYAAYASGGELYRRLVEALRDSVSS